MRRIFLSFNGEHPFRLYSYTFRTDRSAASSPDPFDRLAPTDGSLFP